MFRFQPAKWSPVETDYLLSHRDEPVNQLTIALSKSRAAIKRKLDELDGKVVPQKKGKKGSKAGKREDLLVNGKPQYFRSGWEANFARFLNLHGIMWEYEPHTFFFQGVKRGTNSYCPDFKVTGMDGIPVWTEIKGQLDSKGRAAIRRFKQYYPDEFAKLKAVVGRPGTVADKFFKKMGVPVLFYMNELDKKWKSLENWE